MPFFLIPGSYPDFFLLMTDTKNRSIYRMDLNSYSYEVVPLHNHDNPISIDFDSQNQDIYWTDVGSNQIRSASITGSNEKVVRQLGNSKNWFFYSTFEKRIVHTYIVLNIIMLSVLFPLQIIMHDCRRQLFGYDKIWCMCDIVKELTTGSL